MQGEGIAHLDSLAWEDFTEIWIQIWRMQRHHPGGKKGKGTLDREQQGQKDLRWPYVWWALVCDVIITVIFKKWFVMSVLRETPFI